MTEAAVAIEGLVQRRAHFELGPVELVIPAGYVTAIVGPNGSGKSSLFRLMLGLGRPDAGRVSLLGRRVGDGDDTAYKTRIGYVPEEAIDLEDKISGDQKAAFVRPWYPGWDVNYYRELLRRFEIDAGLKLGKMSKGMRRKYDLSLAMAHHPELLLLDEPSSGLDPIAWKTMIDVLHRYMERGDRTIVMASHIVDEVRRLADYIVFVVHGRVLGMYEKDALQESWQTMYVDDAGRSTDWKGMPGLRGFEAAGGTTYRIVTDSAHAAERWLAEAGATLVSKQKLELDDILMHLTEHARGVM
ncbi:ABC-2 type transport system ATP-binding protein [Paenibacillus sp. UNC496MF]|uniref:ABC transporter ATP-binding protein n=1 Tax=Paenibacillus sp. UNC496MF TaxID=1502753 RepID=UPI0008E74A9C|nr:ABC transporter ATP-binding protein [Paenibacillus sp. UNC496MF]SFJ50663.1 ABC-2 type transport system ATP-binding protein [Paenibacillus sp. UNC496MF]